MTELCLDIMLFGIGGFFIVVSAVILWDYFGKE